MSPRASSMPPRAGPAWVLVMPKPGQSVLDVWMTQPGGSCFWKLLDTSSFLICQWGAQPLWPDIGNTGFLELKAQLSPSLAGCPLLLSLSGLPRALGH